MIDLADVGSRHPWGLVSTSTLSRVLPSIGSRDEAQQIPGRWPIHLEVRQAFAIALLCSLLGAAAAGEIYRCTDPGGNIRFVDDPSSCVNATKHEPRREIVAATPDRASESRGAPIASLEALLPNATQIGPEWEITLEAAVTQVDSDERRWGVVETQARHYGRTRNGVTEVCTIDLWRFEKPSQATAAATGIVYPGWSFEARGALLVTLRATRWQRGQPFQKGLFPACHELGALVRVP
jgi:hypothetical protein